VIKRTVIINYSGSFLRVFIYLFFYIYIFISNYFNCLPEFSEYRIHVFVILLMYISMISYLSLFPTFQLAQNASQRFILHLYCLVFRLLRSGILRYLHTLLYLNSDLYSDDTPDTRYHNSLSFPRHRTSKFKTAFSYTATKFYNILLPSDFCPFFLRFALPLPSSYQRFELNRI